MWEEFGGGFGGIYGTDRENKKGKEGFCQRGKGVKGGVFQEYEGQCRPFRNGSADRIYTRQSTQRLQGEWVYRGKAFLEGSTTIEPPA